MIFWAGKSSDDVGAIVEYYPALPRPARKAETVQIPGRNGDLIYMQDAFENYEQPYAIYISAERIKIPNAAISVSQWLNAPKGYQRLEDSYEPEFFRMACYTGPTDIENILNRFGRAQINFKCKPQRFARTGEYPKTFTKAEVILNPFAFPALPLIKVYGNGSGVLQVGTYAVKFLELNEYTVLDCEMQNAYKGSKNKNNTIYAPEFPRLEPGETHISWTGGIEKIEIAPRWWTL